MIEEPKSVQIYHVVAPTNSFQGIFLQTHANNHQDPAQSLHRTHPSTLYWHFVLVLKKDEFDRICLIPSSLWDSHAIVDPACVLLFNVHGPVAKRSEVCRGRTGISIEFPGSEDYFVSKSYA